MPNHLSPSLLAWLRCFDAVARNSSFTLAAHELHVTQGSVSQQVRKLEDYLGVTLFERHGKQLALTRDGAGLALTSGQALQSLNQAVGRLRRDPHSPGPLNLSCSPSFALLWLTPRIGDLLQGQAGLSVRIHGEFQRLDRAGMGLSGVQAGIRFDPGHYTDLHAETFLDEWLVPVATPQFLHSQGRPASVDGLPPHLMLHDESPWHDAPPHTEWETWLNAAGAPPLQHSGVCFNLSQLAMVAALTGQGVAMGRLALVYDELLSGRLVAAFPWAVRSQASYHFLHAQAPAGHPEHLRQWLHDAGARFARERDALLQRLGITLRG